MTWLPRSLFGRHALLIVGLLLLGQAVSVVLLHRLVYLPRVAHGAQLVARQIGAVQLGLQGLPAADRAAFVDRFNRGVQRALTASTAAGTVDRLALLDREFIRTLSTQLAAQGIEAVWHHQHADSLSLRLTLDGVEHWIVLTSVVPGRAFSGALIAMLIGSMVIALAAALWLQRWLNRPLARVVRAAQALAAEARPEPLPEDGPLEVATVSRSFNKLVGSLSAAERERTLMLAGISHDLRTPLTKLSLGVEILRGSTAEADLLGSMARSVEEMDGIVGQFLDFARADVLVHAAPHSLDELARQVAEAFADHQRPLVLRLGQVPAVPMQPQAIRRVMNNLLENAWRHGRPPVELLTAVRGDSVCFEVRDHGPGVPADEMDRLRQPFARGHAARSGVAGAGLGLAIAERILRQHGGRLDLLGAPGGGLLACATLPTVPPPSS